MIIIARMTVEDAKKCLAGLTHPSSLRSAISGTEATVLYAKVKSVATERVSLQEMFKCVIRLAQHPVRTGPQAPLTAFLTFISRQI